jgi:proline iminopeptidase
MPLYWHDPAIAERFKNDFEAVTWSAAAARGSEASMRFPFDIRKELSAVNAPTLIVVGDDDFIAPPSLAREIHLALPRSKLLLIEQCGHFPWMEQRDEFFREAGRFLDALGVKEAGG